MTDMTKHSFASMEGEGRVSTVSIFGSSVMFINAGTDHALQTKRWIKKQRCRAVRKGVQEVLRGVKVHWPHCSAPTSWSKAELRLMLPLTYWARSTPISLRITCLSHSTVPVRLSVMGDV